MPAEPPYAIDVSFTRVGPSAAIEARVRREAAKLARFHPRIMACHIVVATPHRHTHKGKIFFVRLRLAVPGGNIWINREAALNHAHEDVYVAIRDAFAAATRRLEDHARRLRGQVKQHVAPPHGVVLRLFPEEGYGFLRSSDGEEIYFHRNSVVGNKFDSLRAGSEVRFVAVPGAQGPQASTVRLVGKHHIVSR
jgi:cold shock CspA family protein